MIYNLQVVNKSSSTITVTGKRGDNFDVVALNQTISPNQSLNVATFNAGTLGQDRWGWVFLDIGGVACQIYAESTALGLLEASFGYFNSHSSEGDSNPSPFADGVASAEVPPHDFQSQFVYTLNSQP